MRISQVIDRLFDSRKNSPTLPAKPQRARRGPPRIASESAAKPSQLSRSEAASAPRKPLLAVDYETEEFDPERGIRAYNAKLLGMSVAGPQTRSGYIIKDIEATLRSYGKKHRVYHNALFDRAVELREGLPLAETFDDTLVMARLLDQRRSNGLKDLGTSLLKRSVVKYGDVDRSDAKAFARYACQDATLTLALFEEADLPGQIRNEGLSKAYEIELAAIDPTIAMIHNGILLDRGALDDQIRQSEKSRQDCLKELHQLAGRPINVNSSQQLIDLLYHHLGLPTLVRTKKGSPATDRQTLKLLAKYDQAGAVRLIEEYRRHHGLIQHAKKLIRLVDPRTGRIHCDLNPLAAGTGRYGCRNPPLQAMPEGLLGAFVAEPGHVLIEADFSQIELRVLAHFSQDPAFLAAYRHDATLDIHRRTAAKALGIPEAEVTEEQRKRIGKAVNFGIAFGQTKYGLATKLQISPDKAQAFIDGFLRGYPKIAEWIEGTRSKASFHGFVRTLYGRRRHLPDLFSPDRKRKAKALRQSVNTIVQGTAADILKMTLARLHKALPPSCRLLLAVHDSVLLEVPEEEADEMAMLVRDVMETPPPDFAVPLKADVKIGANWGECKRAG